ncbi:MAG: glycosyltransferase family 39 protein [Planctomycetes bacterium]|nr:glycosyltransferase family 39 protein [Planctomycetota bacterium]
MSDGSCRPRRPFWTDAEEVRPRPERAAGRRSLAARAGWHLAALALLYAGAVLVRGHVNAERRSAGHGDVAAYYQVARNLYQGRGLVQDFVADYLQDPASLPAPSNTWWLPLPSLIAWLGMEAGGDADYATARSAMILCSSLVVALAYAAGLLLLRSRAAALACGVLAVGFHLFLDQTCQTLSHGPYAVFAGGALLVLLALPRAPRLLPLFGLLFGLAYLCRGDSQVLLVSLPCALLLARRRGSLRALPRKDLGLAAALFLLVVAPWWARNERVLGELMPSGVNRAVFARTHEEWFTAPERLTRERYLAWGGERILEQKKRGVLDALSYAPFSLYASLTRGRPLEPRQEYYRLALLGKWVMTPLLWLGLLWLLFRRRAETMLLLVHILLLVVVYGALFSAIGRESFRTSLFSVLPLFVVAIVAALALLLRPLAARAPRLAAGALLSLVVLLSAGNILAAGPHLQAKGRANESMLEPYREFGRWIEERGLGEAVFFCRNPWEFSTETGASAVMIPFADAAYVLDAARRLGVEYLVDEESRSVALAKLRPGAFELVRRGDLQRVEAPLSFSVYRFRPGLLEK